MGSNKDPDEELVEIYPSLGRPSITFTTHGDPIFNGAEVIDSILCGQERLNALCGAKGITREVHIKLIDEVTSIVRLATSAAFEVSRLQGELERKKQENKITEEKQGVSFADTVKNGKKNGKKPQVKRNPPAMVLLYPKNGENTKKVLRTHVAADNIAITSTREVKKGGLLIKARDENEMEKLLQNIECSKDAKEALQVKKITKRRPQIIAYGLDIETREEEVIQAFLTKDPKFDATDCTIAHKQQRKDHVNFILDVHPELYRAHKDQVKIRIGWQTPKIREFARPMQCYNCGLLGHTSKRCTEPTISCTYCGKTGHKWNSCENEPHCRNCQAKNEKEGIRKEDRKEAHACTDVACPTYIKEMKWLKRRVDYASLKHVSC